MKIKYNSPVILTYSLISICVLVFCSGGFITKYFSSPAHLSFSDPNFYIRLVSYIAGHVNWPHLIGNLIIILLVGPLLEEKYGSGKLLEMVLITAITTAFLTHLFDYKSISPIITSGYVFKTSAMALRLFIFLIIVPG